MTDDEIDYLIFFWEYVKLPLAERHMLEERFEDLYDKFVPPRFVVADPDTIPASPIPISDIKNKPLPQDPIVPIISQPLTSDIIFPDFNFSSFDDGYQDGYTASQLL